MSEYFTLFHQRIIRLKITAMHIIFEKNYIFWTLLIVIKWQWKGQRRRGIYSFRALASLASNSYCQGNGSDEILGRRNTKSLVKKYNMFGEEIQKVRWRNTHVWWRNEISLAKKWYWFNDEIWKRILGHSYLNFVDISWLIKNITINIHL